MKQETFQKELKNLTPDVPESFQKKMNAFLDEKVYQEVYMKESTKKKVRMGSRAVVLAFVMVLVLCTAAVAASLNLFGQLDDGLENDNRMGALNEVAAPVQQQVTSEGVTLSVQQAYYDGSRVFVAYRMDGEAEKAELFDGMPEGLTWDWEENAVFGEHFSSDSAAFQKISKWLDGTEPRYAVWQSTATHDCLELADGTILDIVGGEEYELPDGSRIGWKECEVPENKQAKKLDVVISLFTGRSTYYQDANGFKRSYEQLGQTDMPFAVEKDETAKAYHGQVNKKEWQATASLVANMVDIRGIVTVTCPESWTAAWNTYDERNEDADCIVAWQLYVDGKTAEGHNLNAYCKKVSDTCMEYGVCFAREDLQGKMRLVPVFNKSGTQIDKGIDLKVVTE